MGKSEDRVAARRAVQEAQLERQRERAVREKQLQALAVDIQVVLADGQARLRAAETVAGGLITTMITKHGATTRDVVAWCCGTVSQRDIARLRALSDD